jgi:Ca-activated chloride channel family protein
MIESPVLTHVGVAFEGLHTSDVSPAKLPDLLAHRPVVVFGKYQGDPGGQVRLTGFQGGGTPFSQVLPVRARDAKPGLEALRWLWARSWVATLEDEHAMGGGQPVEDAITDLGLRHSLLTPFTSFVAVDSEIANHTGQATPVRQPLPMPEGVSNLAVAANQPVSSTRMSYGAGAGMLRERSVAPASVAAHGGFVARKGKLDSLLESEEAPVAPAKAETKKARNEERDDKARTLHAVVVSVTSKDLGSPERLKAALEAKLRTLSFGASAGGQIVLRLHVGADGKVTAVEVVSGDVVLARTLRESLLGLVGGSRPTTGAEATLTVTLAFR